MKIKLIRNVSNNSLKAWFHLSDIGGSKYPWKTMSFILGGWHIGVSKIGPVESQWRERVEMPDRLKRSIIQIVLDQNIKSWFI